tara:strand:+ start:637 stop:747 length:111 start_codon:yes stop_codon:yes gene_type:complete
MLQKVIKLETHLKEVLLEIWFSESELTKLFNQGIIC